MTVITTRIIVASDGSVTLAQPVPPGEHVIQVEVEEALLTQPLDYATFPKIHVDAWPQDLSLRREDMYGDDDR